MQNLLIFLIIINLILIIASIFGMTNIFKENANPKTMAKYSVFLSILMFLYLAFIGALFIRYTFLSQYSTGSFLVLFFIFPFIIGNFASYRKLKFFTFLQILIFILSFVYIIYLYVNFLRGSVL